MSNDMFKYSNFFRQSLWAAPVIIAFFFVNNTAHAQQHEMMLRISEIEIHPQYLEEYKMSLEVEAEASVSLEKGVIAIFPMFQKDNPTQVRILEMYKDQEAYQCHLKTEHFLKYKTTTFHMVKALKLVDMDALDLDAAGHIFKKMPAN